MFPLPTMYLSPTPVMQFFDNNGEPLVGGKLFLYAAGTTTKQAAFTDAAGLTQLPNPIIMNARGEVAASATGTSVGLWLDPTLAYKMVLAPSTDTDPPTNSFWTVDNIVSPESVVLAALAAYQATLGGAQIGSLVAYGGATAPSGWLLCYGQAISRTTYSALFAIMGVAFGPGDNATTFNLPDLRGRLPLGKDDMGGSGANRVTNGVSGVNATVLGATGGDQHAQADTLAATSAATVGVTDPGHTHGFQTQSNGGGPADQIVTSIAGGAQPDGTTRTAFTGVGVSVTVTTAVTSGLTGASQNMPPVQVVNYIVFTGIFS